MNTDVGVLKTSDRVKEVVSILTKYGFADWLSQTNITWLKKYLKKADKEHLERYTSEERVRLAITELGTTFIKLGQILSTRTDLVSPRLIKELVKLQSSTPKDGIAAIRRRIKHEFGVKSLKDLFSNFDTKPIASASIAQVHRATLQGGEDVVVKVMHEGIESKVQEDLKILTKFAALAEQHSKQLKAYQPMALIRHFSQTMLAELDFSIELNNIIRFNENFKYDDRVVFPKPYPGQSGKTVLTMSFVQGYASSKIEELEWSQDQTTTFAENSANVFMDMMFRDRFYHADPHPGNLFIRKDGSLGLIDCGMVAKIDSRTGSFLEELITGVAEKNPELVKNTVLEMCSVPGSAATDVLESQIEDFIEQYLDLPLNQFDLSKAISQGFQIIRQHHLTLPPNVSSLFRVIVMLEGSSRVLNPDFNIALLLKRYNSKIIKRRLAPKAILQRISKNIHTWEKIVDQLPSILNRLINVVGKGDFEINLEHRNLEKSVNRMVMGMITSSIFLGSSLLWAFKVPPVYKGYSVVGVLGVLVSGILTYSIMLGITKNK